MCVKQVFMERLGFSSQNWTVSALKRMSWITIENFMETVENSDSVMVHHTGRGAGRIQAKNLRSERFLADRSGCLSRTGKQRQLGILDGEIHASLRQAIN